MAIAHPAETLTLLALAKSFDFELTLPFIPRFAQAPIGNNGVSGQEIENDLGDRGIITGDELVAAWSALLNSNRTYDVVLLAPSAFSDRFGINWSPWTLLPESLQTEILRRVQTGTGLVVIRRGDVIGTTSSTAQLRSSLPLTFQSGSDFHGPLQVSSSSNRVTNGLPWTIMPGFEARINGYTAAPGAEVLLSIDYAGQPLPLLARSSFGSGIVFDLVWGSSVVPPDSFRRRPAGSDGMDTLRYDLALLARIIDDASGHGPEIAIKDVSFAGNSAIVAVEQVQTTANGFVLDWIARDRFGTKLAGGQQTATIFPVSRTVAFPIPTGAWTVDVVLQPTTGGPPSWGAGGRIFDIATSVIPSLDTFNPSDQLQIAPASIASIARYIVDTVDGRGRVTLRQVVGFGGMANITLDRVQTPRVEVRIHAIDSAGALVGQSVRTFRVRMRTGFQRWPMHFWNNSGAILPQSLFVRLLDSYASSGISAYMPIGEPFPPTAILSNDIVTAADRLAMPYCIEAAGWVANLDQGGVPFPAPVGGPCTFKLTDSQLFVSEMVRATGVAAVCGDLNVFYYRIGGDEPHPVPTDVSFDDCTIAQFRSWLSNTYGSADSALQREWGATAALSTAMPLSIDNAISAFAADPTYAPWVDHRRFIMDLFSRAPNSARVALLRGDGFALAGTSGEAQMGVSTSRDWWVRGQALDVVGRYAASMAFELKAVGARSTVWTAYDDPDPIIRHRVWTALGLGEDGLALFSEATLINPDLSLPEVGRDLTATLLLGRRGVGTLFATSEPANDGVWVLTSPDSSAVLAIHGYDASGPVENYEGLGNWAAGGGPPAPAEDLGIDAREGVHAVLAAMGVGWSAISPAEIETGALDRNGARVLILPMCAAISDAGCYSIQRWVSRGGALIADLLPGTFTAHGRLRGSSISSGGVLQSSSNPLDSVFGLTPGARPSVNNDTVVVGGGTPFPVHCVDDVVTASSAQSSGTSSRGSAVWFQNSYVQGRAAYLGCSFFSDYNWSALKQLDASNRRANKVAMEEAFESLLASMNVVPRVRLRYLLDLRPGPYQLLTREFTRLLRWVGLIPEMEITEPIGGRVGLSQFYVRSFGAAELILVLRDYEGVYDPVEPEADGELLFTSAAHTYDLENGTYLGLGDRLRLRVSAYSFRVFSRLPYRVLYVNVQLGNVPRLGDPILVTVALGVEGGQPSRHRVRVDVLDPANSPLPHLASEAMLEFGTGSFSIHSAFNDPPGMWTVVVTDVATGTRGRVLVNLSLGTSEALLPEVLNTSLIDD